MTVGEAIHIYRDYRHITPKDFSVLVFVSEADIQRAEETENDDSFSIEELLRLFQFFSMKVGVSDEEANIKDIVAHLVSDEIRKRTNQN